MLKKRLVQISSILLIHIVLASCGGNEQAYQDENLKPVPVSVSRVTMQPVAGINSYSGTVEPLEKVHLSTRISGLVENIYVEEGQAVKKNQLLVKLRSNDLKAKRSQAEATIAEAEVHYQNAGVNLKRIKSLFTKKAATQKELDDMNAMFASAEARRQTAYEMKKEIEALLSYSILKAPFDGWVTRKLVEVGDLATPGQPIMEIENIRQLKIAAKIPETDVANLKIGTKTSIQITSYRAAKSDTSLTGKINQILPAADPRSRQFEIKVLVDNPGQRIKSGMFARISLAGPGNSALLVPKEAIFRRGQLEGVFLVDEQNKARLRWIRTGQDYGARIEVLSGLNPGEVVVTGGTESLFDGQAVEVNL